MSWKEQIDSPYDSWNYLGKDKMNLEGYDYLSEKDVKVIFLDQIRQLESRHFQHTLYEPSKLENQQVYIEWQQIKLALDTQIKQCKKKMNEYSVTKEDLLELLEAPKTPSS